VRETSNAFGGRRMFCLNSGRASQIILGAKFGTPSATSSVPEESHVAAAVAREITQPKTAVLKWLLDSDPSIRWQVMGDLLDLEGDAVAAERARVAVEGWGARLLGLQGPDGNWGGGPWVRHSWASTMETLMLLREMGLDPASDQARNAIRVVRERSSWGPEFHDSPFFEGEVEPCINGRVLACGAYFGEASDRLVDRLLGEQLDDGGWNCEAPRSRRSSFNSTICVLEGLWQYEKTNSVASSVRQARLRGQEYLLERRLFRSLSTGKIIEHDRKDPRSSFTRFSFPTRWHYDVLWGLDYLRKAGVRGDQRTDEAVDLVAKRRHQNGRWPLGRPHEGKVHFEMEGARGTASRWNTLRALRVLRWYTQN
jgi:hypothetical protein